MWRKWAPYLAVVVVRTRFFFSPMAIDEGGYLAVARAWFHGADLYRIVWVDRPQGLLVLYGLLDSVGLGSTFGIRLLSLVACAVSMWACGEVAGVLFGARARLAAVWATGLALSIPQIEGFTANGEILSCAAGAVALCLALRSVWGRDVPDIRSMVLAGLAAGTAVTLKQSGFDASIAAAVAVVISGVSAQWPLRTWMRAVGAAMAGVVLPVGLMLLHAALTGFHDWWWAVAGVRFQLKSALAPADYDKLRETAGIVAPIIAAAVIVAKVTLLRAARRHRLEVTVLFVWALAAFGAFWTGGLFHRHYWTILMYPAATAVGAALSMVKGRRTAIAATLAVLVVPVVSTAQAIAMTDARVGAELHGDTRLVRNERAAAWVRSHVPTSDRVWVMCASSSLYAEMHHDPPVRYLWFAYYRAVPDAMEEVLTLLESSDAPQWIVQVQEPRTCDPTGALGSLLAARYRPVEGTSGWVILRRAG